MATTEEQPVPLYGEDGRERHQDALRDRIALLLGRHSEGRNAEQLRRLPPGESVFEAHEGEPCSQSLRSALQE